MRRTSIAIVGAGMAGGRAAEALRSSGFDGTIHLVGAEAHPPYERPPLSKQILLGTMTLEDPSLNSEEQWERLDVDLVLSNRVERIVPAEKALFLSEGPILHVDQVLLCTGSRNRRLSVPGAGRDGVVHFRTLDDAQELRERLRPGATVVIVGGGLIGGEIASSALAIGCRPIILEMEQVPFERALGSELATKMLALHRQKGVDVRVGAHVAEIKGSHSVTSVLLADGSVLPTDVVVVGIGVKPNDELASEAGALIDNGIRVDEFGATSVEGLFAAGEVANHPNPLFARRLRLESWDHAQKHAASVAANMTGAGVAYEEIPWFWTDQHGVNLQIAGLPGVADHKVVRGDPDSLSFCEFGLLSGVLVSATAANQAKDLRRSLPLIRGGVRPPAEMLADPSVDLRSLSGALTSRTPPA